jgi:hypothetical protein
MIRRPFAVFPLILVVALAIGTTDTFVTAGEPTGNPPAIQMDQIGATAEKQYSGDGLSVYATDGGARLCCVFQKMEGEITPEGLWLNSTANSSQSERFRIVATALGRTLRQDARDPLTLVGFPNDGEVARRALPAIGTVEVADKVVFRWRKPMKARHLAWSQGRFACFLH